MLSGLIHCAQPQQSQFYYQSDGEKPKSNIVEIGTVTSDDSQPE